MTDWPIDPIETHEDDAVGRLTSQYDSAELLQGLIRIWARRIQALEDASQQLLTERWIPDAEGEQLDRLGQTLGEPRLGRDDEAYRNGLLIRVIANQSGGQPELVLQFLRQFVEGTGGFVFYREAYPAAVELTILGLDVDEADILEQARGLLPVAIGASFIVDPDINPFIFSELVEGDAPFGDGWGELGMHLLEFNDGEVLETDDGTLFGMTDRTDPVLPQQPDGGFLVEL